MRHAALICVAIVIVGSLVISATVAYLSLRPAHAIRALPAEATEVHEYYWEAGGIIGDFTRCVKAKMSPSGFDAYVRSLGLKQKYAPSEHAELPLGIAGECQESWWNPSASLNGAYFNHVSGEEYFELAKYENGYAYYVVTEW